MKKISRRKMVKVSGSSAIITALGLSQLTSMANGHKAESGGRLKIVVVGGHPDDPETGCGGAMALFSKAGHEVVSAYFTRGEAGIRGKSHEEAARIRTEESLRACKILKARPAFIGQIDGNTEITKSRYKEMSDFIQNEQPDIVFTHWPLDTHPDHRICSNLVYDAWLKSGKKFALFYYEVMSGKQTQNFLPTDYVDITSVIQQKHSAVFVHKSQNLEKIYEATHGRMELFRGREFGCKYAEAFIHHVQSPRVILP